MIIRSSRNAVTLTEVLIAIFLMGIGLMAVLSLFPLGAAQMAQAIQDQRAAEAATTAAGFARFIWNSTCDQDESIGDSGQVRFADMNPSSPYFGQPRSNQSYVMAMDDPQLNVPSTAGANAALTRLPLTAGQMDATNKPYTRASYPVLLDPIGWLANSANDSNKYWLGNVPDASNKRACWIPRRTLNIRDTTCLKVPQPWIMIGTSSAANGTGGSMPQSNLPIFKHFSLMDDMTFNATDQPNFGPAGVPKQQNYTQTNTGPDAVERQGRYSWAYLFRRPHNSARTSVDITCILYSGRSIDVPSQEITYPGQGFSFAAAAQQATLGNSVNPKELILDYTKLPKPAVRRGGWVLDASILDNNGRPDPQGIFYRVVNVDDSKPPLLYLELQTPLLGGPFPPTTVPRSIVVMDKVVEVFTKTDVSRVSPPMPY